MVAAMMLTAATWLSSSAANAQDEVGFQSYLQQVRARAIAKGVRPGTADQVLAGLTFNPRVVELDHGQPGGNPANPTDSAGPPFAPYLRRHVDSARISMGRTKYLAERRHLARIEAETGVPESIMVAIWGHETSYGRVMGNFDLPRAIATLAYDGRRRDLFEGELIAMMKMVDRGVARSQLVGSWAGAMGGPQFLPSVYLRLARDGDGDGRADIWNSDADTLASIGNYFYNAGWRRGQPWGIAVAVPAGFDRESMATKLISPRCPRVFARQSVWRSMGEWRAMGFASLDKPWPADTVQAALIEPDGPGQTAYLLTGNYRVILDYNCSNFYALSVGLLADAVEQ
ncbi:MAG TPA: lytic murein transglycosylase [Sphingomonas sp.]|jgi:lytic murein transglycosylase|nr:lytic murein transglycosylase [Sphingomonas sp.]HEX4693766.1 lytic murein transglycosylase [Sphingomonas sp.]